MQRNSLSLVVKAKTIATVDGDMNSTIFIYEDGTIDCSSSLKTVCDSLQKFVLDYDGTLYRRVHAVSIMDDHQIALQMRNGSIAYASEARSARYDNLSQVLELGESTFFLYHNQTLIEERQGSLAVVKEGIQQILAAKGELYAVDNTSVYPDVGLRRLRGTTRRIGEFRSFRFEWDEAVELADPCTEYTYAVELGKYVCKERKDRQEVDYGVITGRCTDGFRFTIDACVCDGGRVVSLDGKCVDACPIDQDPIEG